MSKLREFLPFKMWGPKTAYLRVVLRRHLRLNNFRKKHVTDQRKTDLATIKDRRNIAKFSELWPTNG